MTLIFFFWGGGGGWRGEMENCAYLRKNPGYAPVIVENNWRQCFTRRSCFSQWIINRSQQSGVIYRTNCWDCNGFYIGKTKWRLHDRKTEHFKAVAENDTTSAIADHVKAAGHIIKWDHFDILEKGKTDYHCKIKEIFIEELESAFNVNVGSEKLMLY